MKRWLDVLDFCGKEELLNFEKAIDNFIESRWDKFSYEEIYTALCKEIEIKMYEKEEIEHDL